MPLLNRLIAPTTEAAASVEFGIPPLVWSPDPDVCRGTAIVAGGTVNNDYPGRELKPREITLVLHAAPGDSLPDTAEAYLEVHTGDDAEGQPHYERIRTLTPAHKTLLWRGPIEGMRVSKPHSDDAYGVAAFGLFGETPLQSS